MKRHFNEKIYSIFSGSALLFLSAGAMATKQNVTNIITCSLPGEGVKEALFFIDNVTKEINYNFKRDGKVELNVIFNEANKLRRTRDNEMGVTYYGFKRGKYIYVINVIDGSENNEYTMSFDILKNKRIIQSRDCLTGSFRSDDIVSDYIVDIPYVNKNGYFFP
ncbi:TPA: hypothetical protein ACNFPT_000965 [Enterobacter ludwigii]|nr:MULTISPECIES: hypothetical protein [Enterobacter]EKS7192951.1 hypothetical protein [Enterobacter ludwigii]EKS7206502.1 hypothetical protein [Enterobacter ludwigii]KAA0523381.1 hypothetical protein F0325_03475 [Enterobacter ludwigii]KYO11682.1 hypothetical protein ABR30_0203170 [Enterobacter ludwigii]MBT1849094.1 hypothetical protein [Enterobacter ludwigii]